MVFHQCQRKGNYWVNLFFHSLYDDIYFPYCHSFIHAYKVIATQIEKNISLDKKRIGCFHIGLFNLS
jgi:hypothetical protein